MDATPTNRRQNRREMTPLLHTPNISGYAEVDLSPSFQNLHSRLGSLRDTGRDSNLSTPQRASPILKRARFESPGPSPDISSDFLTRKLREANGAAPSYQPPQQSTPPQSSTGAAATTATPANPSLDSVLIAKQTEINDLKAQIQRAEQKSAQKLEESRHQLQQERKYGQDQVLKLDSKLKSVQQEAQSLANRSETQLQKSQAEAHNYKSRLAEYETRVADLTQECEAKDAECARLKEKTSAGSVKASRLETRINELEAALRTSRSSVEAAQDKEISATLRCEEAQSMKTGLLQQISHLESKLEDLEHQHTQALDDKQAELNQWRLKLNEREKELKSTKDSISIFRAAEEKLSQENDDLHKLIANEKVQTSRSEARLRVAKGEIAELKEQIQANTAVRDLQRKLEAQQADLERASGILDERNERIKRLEHDLSESGRSAEFSRIASELEGRNQAIQALNKTVSELKSQQRQDSIAESSLKTQLETLREEVRQRDALLSEAQIAIQDLRANADTTSKHASALRQEYDKLDATYKRVYSEYLSEVEKIRGQAQTELDRMQQAKWEASSRHTREIEEVNRQKDQAVLAQQQQLEQKFTDLSTQSGQSLAEALRDQRQQLERDYNQYLQRVDQSTEERIAQIKELAHLEVNEFRRELEQRYNTHTGQVQQLEEDCAALERKLSTTLKAFKIVFEYFTASKARNDFIMADLIFIKRIATSCLDQLEQDDYRRLAALGIAPTRPRTFAGVATFVLAIGRLHRLTRPQVPEKLRYEFERFIETKRVD